MRVLRISWITLALLGQERPQTKVEALMAHSVGQQLEAVRKQTASPGAFFLLPAFLLSPPPSLGAADAAPSGGCRALSDAELMPLVSEAARGAGVKPEWLLAVVAEGSQDLPCVLSPAGAASERQPGAATVEPLHEADETDLRQDLAARARLLAQLIARYQGDFGRARAAYEGTAGASPVESGSSQVAPMAPVSSQKTASLADKKE